MLVIIRVALQLKVFLDLNICISHCSQKLDGVLLPFY